MIEIGGVSDILEPLDFLFVCLHLVAFLQKTESEDVFFISRKERVLMVRIDFRLR